MCRRCVIYVGGFIYVGGVTYVGCVICVRGVIYVGCVIYEGVYYICGCVLHMWGVCLAIKFKISFYTFRVFLLRILYFTARQDQPQCFAHSRPPTPLRPSTLFPDLPGSSPRLPPPLSSRLAGNRRWRRSCGGTRLVVRDPAETGRVKFGFLPGTLYCWQGVFTVDTKAFTENTEGLLSALEGSACPRRREDTKVDFTGCWP